LPEEAVRALPLGFPGVIIGDEVVEQLDKQRGVACYEVSLIKRRLGPTAELVKVLRAAAVFAGAEPEAGVVIQPLLIAEPTALGLVVAEGA
jgi:hypothetical protein